jgi:hypothetical protein
MERRFHVVFTGRLHAGFKHAETVEKMVALFQLDKEKVTKLLFSGRPTIMKKDLTREQARKYYHHLERIGLQITIIEAEPSPPQASTALSSSPSPAPAPENPALACKEFATVTTPTEALKSSPSPENPDTSTIEVKGQGGNPPPFRVEYSHGWLWTKEAFGMFFQQPLTWTAMVLLMLVIIVIPLVFNPNLGGLLSIVLVQIFQGGLMFGAQRQKEDGRLQIVHLFHGFRHNFSQLLLGSFFYLLALTAQATIAFLCIGKILSTGIAPTTPEAINTLFRSFPLYLFGLLIAMALSIPLMMGYWFTPCLATLDDRTVFASFRLSFKAFRINSVAFFMYALTFLLLGILFLFLFGAMAAFFSFLLGSDHFFLLMIMPMLCMIILGIPLTAIVPLSIYTGYRDIFHGRDGDCQQITTSSEPCG